MIIYVFFFLLFIQSHSLEQKMMAATMMMMKNDNSSLSWTRSIQGTTSEAWEPLHFMGLAADWSVHFPIAPGLPALRCLMIQMSDSSIPQPPC